MVVLFTEILNDESVTRRVVEGCYMMSSILFIFSLYGLKKAVTSRRGVFFGVCGMLIAIISSLFLNDFHNQFFTMGTASIPGAIVGFLMAFFVEMLNIPQMIASLHCFVGIAATLVGFSNYYLLINEAPSVIRDIETYVGIFVGVVTFAGSVIAAMKLADFGGGKMGECLHDLGWVRHALNISAGLATVVIGALFCMNDKLEYLLYANVVLGIFIGCHMVLAVGSSDMPVIISMLNSYSGWATAASGFLLNNKVLIITGAVVGSSGAILSYIMCDAMNRSFFNVLLTKYGPATPAIAAAPQPTVKAGEKKEEEVVKNKISIKQAYDELMKAQNIIIVPGFGMASAKCHKDVGEVAKLLIKQKKQVRFCLHPVAGRMPGHMNVLLCEARVPFKYMFELSHINSEFPKCDLALVVGSNDTVNPDALKKDSPISGMAVCEVWNAKKVIVVKRKRGGVGFAGVDNELFDYPNTSLLLEDAKIAFVELTRMLGHSYNADEVARAIPMRPAPEERKGEGKKGDEGKKEVKKAELKPVEDPRSFPKKMLIGVPREIVADEKRVAITPSAVAKLRRMKFGVRIEKDAGRLAGFENRDYEAAGAEITDTEGIWADSDIIIKIHSPRKHPDTDQHEAALPDKAQLLVSYFDPGREIETKDLLLKHPNLSVWSMENVPRITTAQKLDTMSSMYKVDGYRAVIEALKLFRGFAGMQVTAAGTIEPAKVFVIGCGVIGLSAISTATSLGARVEAFDARQKGRSDGESAGAEIVIDEELKMDEGAGTGGYAKVMDEKYYKAQRDFFVRVLKDCDIVISTARVPGGKKLLLITKEAVRGMKKGSVIMDIAGSNCELTEEKTVKVDEVSQVTISGITSYVGEMPRQASELYSCNMLNLMGELCKCPEGQSPSAETYSINVKDAIAEGAVVIHKGKLRWITYEERVKKQEEERKKVEAERLKAGIVEEVKKPTEKGKEVKVQVGVPAEGKLSDKLLDRKDEDEEEVMKVASMDITYSGSIVLLMVLLSVGLAYSTDYKFMLNFVIFLLALIIGFIVVWGVDPLLHASLMSETNAISGIIYIGAMLQLYGINGDFALPNLCGSIALFFASINVIGGFVLTERMLRMIAC